MFFDEIDRSNNKSMALADLKKKKSDIYLGFNIKYHVELYEQFLLHCGCDGYSWNYMIIIFQLLLKFKYLTFIT